MPRKLNLITPPKTTTIHYAEKPPLLGGKPITMQVEDFAKKNGFEWTDDFMLSENLEDDRKRMVADPDFQKKVLAYTFLDDDDEGIPKVLPITETEIIEKFNTDFFLKKALPAAEKIVDSCKQYIPQVFSLVSDLVICHIDPKVGKGVFLKKDAPIIKKGTAVAMYIGVYQKPDDNFGAYEYTTQSHPLFAAASPFRAYGHVDTERYGGIARFIQSMPEQEELSEFKFSREETRAEIATANLEVRNLFYQGMPVAVFIAATDIKPGEQLGYSYGSNYWTQAECELGNRQLLFDKKGELIANEKYQYTYLAFKFKAGIDRLSVQQLITLINSDIPRKTFNCVTGLATTTSANELLKMAVEKLEQEKLQPGTILASFKEWGELKLKSNMDLNYRESFCVAVKMILLEHWLVNQCKQDTLSLQKVNYLQELLAVSKQFSSEKTDEMYLAIQQILKEPTKKTFYEKCLTDMRSALIQAMTKYNTGKRESISKAPVVSLRM